ncbi:MAG: tetratricopeptide repeat protein [Phycisphaerae bacterium]
MSPDTKDRCQRERVRPTLLPAVCLMWLAAGCGQTKVEVRHELPSDLPMVAVPVSVGSFEVKNGDGEYGEFLANSLAAQLDSAGLLGKAEAPSEMGGTAEIRTDRQQGTRTVRKLKPETGEMVTEQLTTLRRTAHLRVNFVITDADGKKLATIETNKSYDSVEDPRARGELGLDRPGDPDLVPSRDTILRELVVLSVQTAVEMLDPPVIQKTLTLRGSWNAHARKAADAAEANDLVLARKHLQQATEEEPNQPDLWYDLGVICEATGVLPEALDAYRRATELAPKDEQIAQAAQRVQRVIERKRNEPINQSTNQPISQLTN